MVALRTAGNMLTPLPSLSKTMRSARGPHEHDSRRCPKVDFGMFFDRDGVGAASGWPRMLHMWRQSV
eukprot:9501801-Pyramimonas_sp.AAC.1